MNLNDETRSNAAHWHKAATESAAELLRVKERLGIVDADASADPVSVIDMLQSWEADAKRRADQLAQHLLAVLEIARTWQPDYATKMDRDTLDLAAAEVGHKALAEDKPGCKTPPGCAESGCLGWCDEYKPEVAARCEGCAALRDQLRDEVENNEMRRLVSDLVKRDAHRFRKLMMQHKHWLGVFRCDPDGAPSDSLSHVELTALLDAMDGPEVDF